MSFFHRSHRSGTGRGSLRAGIVFSILVAACHGQNLDRIHAFDTGMREQEPLASSDFDRTFGPSTNRQPDEPELDLPAPIGGTVSVDSLAKPPSRAAVKILNKAIRYSEAGNSAKAIEILRNAPMDPAGAPYLHSRLGTEYLKTGQYALALPELQEAALLLPKEPAHHSNLAYAYQMLGQLDRAETEARVAVNLDHSNVKARFLLGSILMNRPTTLQEAVTNLKFAREDLPTARFLLSQVYLFLGQRDAAQREIQDFLSVATPGQLASARQWIAMHSTNK